MINKWREILEIVARHSPEGEKGDFICCAEHDFVCFGLTSAELDPKSPDGIKMQEVLHCTPNIEGVGTWGKHV